MARRQLYLSRSDTCFVSLQKHKTTKVNMGRQFGHDSEEDSEQEIWSAEGRSDLALFEPSPPPRLSKALLVGDEERNSEEDPLASDEETLEPLAAD